MLFALLPLAATAAEPRLDVDAVALPRVEAAQATPVRSFLVPFSTDWNDDVVERCADGEDVADRGFSLPRHGGELIGILGHDFPGPRGGAGPARPGGGVRAAGCYDYGYDYDFTGTRRTPPRRPDFQEPCRREPIAHRGTKLQWGKSVDLGWN